MQTQHQVSTNPQTKPTNSGCEFACRPLLPTHTVTIYYYYSTQKLTFILPSQ